MKDVVEKCSSLLDQIGNQNHGYEDQLISMFTYAYTAASMAEGEEFAILIKKMRDMLRLFLPEDMPKEILDAYDLMDDERFSELMKLTVNAFMLLDGITYPGESFHEYAMFMQMDAFLCQLEAWPMQRRELELLKKEYPDIYECGTEIWDMLRISTINKAYMREDVLAEYGKMERKFQCGHYYEMYPNRRQEEEQVQWDSQENGTFVRQNRKIGRNEPCPCGSGKKYKNCCGKGL